MTKLGVVKDLAYSRMDGQTAFQFLHNFHQNGILLTYFIVKYLATIVDHIEFLFFFNALFMRRHFWCVLSLLYQLYYDNDNGLDNTTINTSAMAMNQKTQQSKATAK